MPTQSELDQIWDSLGPVDNAGGPPQGRPKKLIDEDEKHSMSIPNSSGTHRKVYERHPNGPWKEVPFNGGKSKFA